MVVSLDNGLRFIVNWRYSIKTNQTINPAFSSEESMKFPFYKKKEITKGNYIPEF